MTSANKIHYLSLPEKDDQQRNIEGSMQLPEPLTPADCDLTSFPYFPFEVVKFRGSEFATTVDPAAGFYAITLWAAAWHQVPAASLPDNDAVLAHLAGFGRYVAEWLKVKEQALYGFVKCNDGRLYHKHLAIHANEAWGTSLKRKNAVAKRWDKERNAKENQRNQSPVTSSDTSALQVNNTSDTSALQVNNTCNRTEQNRTEIEDKTPFNTPHETDEAEQPEIHWQEPPATQKAPKITKFNPVLLDSPEYQDTFRVIMQEEGVTSTLNRWKLVSSDFVDYWHNTASNSSKYKKTDWLKTWENAVRKHVNFNKLKWKTEDGKLLAKPVTEGKHALSENYLMTGRGVDWDRIQAELAGQEDE